MSTTGENQSENKITIFFIIKNWFLNSPTHGIRRISRAKSIAGRIFWSTIFIIFTTFMCFFVYTIIQKFNANPTKISLTVQQNRDVDHIPTITFCNLNPLSYRTFVNERQNNPYSQCSHEGNDDDRHRFTEYMCRILTESSTNTHLSIFKAGYQLNELLIQCKFNQQDCDTNFQTFFHPNYGNCYTFNPTNLTEIFSYRTQTSSLLYDEETIGINGRLFLELFSCQHEFIQDIEDRAGFRIFLHRKHEIPILAENSLLLSPKTYTQLIYSQRIIQFSQQCRTDLTDEMKKIFNSNSVRYSQALCFKLCEFRFIEDECHCTDQFFLVFTRFFSANRTIPINTKRPCPIQKTCSARTRFKSKEFCRQCLPECELVQYTIQSSYADYPNMRSIETVSNRIEKHLKMIINESNRTASACLTNRKLDILDGIIAVEISASPYATEILTESPMYTWVDLISSIGGQTGLWIGVNLMSFVEIIELLFLLFCHFLKFIYQKILNRWKIYNEPDPSTDL